MFVFMMWVAGLLSFATMLTFVCVLVRRAKLEVITINGEVQLEEAFHNAWVMFIACLVAALVSWTIMGCMAAQRVQDMIHWWMT